ncbi:MAG: hypothetical protein WBA89_19545 [Microcoleus sp.]
MRLHRNHKIESTVNSQPFSFSTRPSTVNSQQSTVNNHLTVQPELILLQPSAFLILTSAFCYKYLPLCQQFLSQLITDRPQVYGKVKKCHFLAFGSLLTHKKVNLAHT